MNLQPAIQPTQESQICRLEARQHVAGQRKDHHWNIALRREQAVIAYRNLQAAGMSPAAAATELRMARSTLDRWLKLYEAEGINGLLPRTGNSGRKSTLAKLGLDEESLAAMLNECKGLNLDLDSDVATLRAFANTNRCPEALAKVILDPNRCSKHALPPSLRKAIKVTKSMRDAHRGPRRLSLKGFYVPRKIDVLPGDIFSSDDTTAIWGAWVPWIESEEYPFGVKLLQVQHLPLIDVASQCCLTYALIAREKSSYRACDIWALFGHAFDMVGLPRLGMQLERGSWEANLIAGEEVVYQEGEATLSRRVGGLRQLPANITDWHRTNHPDIYDNPHASQLTLQTWTSFLPKSKSVEAFINRSQTFEGAIYGSLGRDQMRKPFEKMKKMFQRCSRPKAKIDAREHFLSVTEIVARLNRMYDYLNHEPMEGEVFKGIPIIKLNQALSERPLFRLPEDQRWLYRRDWKRLTITQGWARVRLTHPISGERYSLFYTNPGVFADIEGRDVVVYYDRDQYEEPAQILCARTGDFICEARYFDRVGSFLDGERSGHEIAKAWRNAVMTAYGTVAGFAPSRQLPAEIAARREEGRERRAGSEERGAGSTLTDGRPPAVVRPQRRSILSRTPEEIEKQGNRFARQAQRARELAEQFS